MADQTTQPINHGKILASWKFPEVPVYKRSRNWYIGMAIAGSLLLIWSVFDRNALFAIIVVMSWALIFFRSRQEPRWLTANVTEDGLEVGNDFYAYDDLASFWIIYKPPVVKTVYLRFKSALRPILGISLENANPVTLRKHLRSFLEEDLSKEDESASDAYGRLFKI